MRKFVERCLEGSNDYEDYGFEIFPLSTDMDTDFISVRFQAAGVLEAGFFEQLITRKAC